MRLQRKAVQLESNCKGLLCKYNFLKTQATNEERKPKAGGMRANAAKLAESGFTCMGA